MKNSIKILLILLLGVGFTNLYSQSDAMKKYFEQWEKNLNIARSNSSDLQTPQYDFSEVNPHQVLAIFVDNQYHEISEDAEWMLEQLVNLPNDAKSFIINQMKKIDKDIRMSTKWIGLPFNISNLALATTAFNTQYTDNWYSYGNFATPYYAGISEGLRIDSVYDERMNNVMSAYATARYISRLQANFERWTYALYAYIHTSAVMQNHIQNGTAETLDNIPFHALVAALLFSKKHQNLLLPEGNELPDFEIVYIQQQVHLEQLAEYLNLSVPQLKNFNPELMGNVIYGNQKKTPFKLPKTHARSYHQYAEYIPKFKKDEYFPTQTTSKKQRTEDILASNYDITYYKIRPGDNLGSIASRFKVRMSDLKDWNNIRGETIFAGSTLLIYQAKKTTQNTAVSQSSNPVKSSTCIIPSDYAVIDTHVVRDGETLASIARKYPGVSYQNIMDWNNITHPTKLHVGAKLKIYGKK